MTKKTHAEFNVVIRFAQDQGLTNIFEIAAWWSQGLSGREIMDILRTRIQQSRSNR
jgi:hypothetical protein